MQTYEKSFIIYDGECIFCQNYVRLVRLRQSVGIVELVDARSDDPRIGQYWRQGFDLNDGMVFVHRGRVFYGAEAVHILAALSGSNSLFNKVNRFLFSSSRFARMMYPLMRIGRRLTLRALGRKRLAVRR